MSTQKAEMTVERIENGQYVEQVAYPFVEYDHVTMENGMDILSMIRDDVSTPLVTHDTSSWKVGQGDSDISETIVDSSVASMTIKGQTYQNILPEPSLRNSMTDGKTMQKLNEGCDSVNTVDGVYKSAILSGSTKYRDIDTGEILEAFEEGRNLELVSVKMPVLTTSTTLINYDVQFTDTGKDLISDFIKIPENIKGKILYPSFNTNKINENTSKQFGMETYDSNKQLLSRKGYWLNNCYNGLSPIILNEEVNYVKFEAWSCYELLGSNGKIGLTEMKNINYIPYKSNILTTPQDVVLRKIGDVEDTLDLITGECVQRIGEIVLDGSKEWKLRGMTTDVIVFSIDDIGINSFTDFTNSHKKMLCDKFVCGYYENNNIEFTCCRASGKGLLIGVLKTKLETQDTVGLKQYLSTNNVTIQYQLETESVKTVDLSILDQDNQPVEQLQSYANGYIQLSSNVAEGEYSLTPSIEYEVPTSNSYYVDLMKANTQYTMKNMTGTFTLYGTQYNASANGTFMSPSTLSNKFMVTSVVQSQPMLLEGDMTSEEVPYIEGIKSTFEGVDKVEIVSQNAANSLSNTTSFQLTNPLRSLPNGVRDEIVLDRVNHKAKIIQRVGEDLTQLDTPIVTEVNLEGYPYVYKGGHIFLNTEIAPITEVTYSINQAHQIESSNEDILRHQKEINHLYELIAQYVQVQYEAELIDIALQG